MGSESSLLFKIFDGMNNLVALTNPREYSENRRVRT